MGEQEFSDTENMKINEVMKEQTFFVVQKNDLILSAKNELTEYELKLIDFLISKIKFEDNEIKPVKTTVGEITKVLNFPKGGVTTTRVKEALYSLYRKGFWFRNEEEKKNSMTNWLEVADIYDNNDCVLKLHRNLEPYLINVVNSGFYTQYYLMDVVNLRGKYAILLYQLLRVNTYKNNFMMSVPELLGFFGKSDWSFYRFNDKSLKRAIKEIEEKTRLRVEMKTVRKGNKTEAVIFNTTLKEVEIITDLPVVPLHNWLEN